jgi:hypothetical protein
MSKIDELKAEIENFPIGLRKQRELWKDIQDVLVSRSRRHEKRIPLDVVKAGLIRSGKLSLASLSRHTHSKPAKITASLVSARRSFTQ